MLASVSTLLIIVGLTQQTLYCRERRARTRLAACALDRGHQSRLLAADERARTETDVEYRKLKPVPNMSLPNRPYSRACSMAICETLDCDRVLRTDIYVAFVCADCIAGDGHRLNARRAGRPQEPSRSINAPGSPSSALQTTYFLSDTLLADKVPLRAGGKARAAASAQAAESEMTLDDLVGRHFGQTLCRAPDSRPSRCIRR